jgi:hypothetical protein
MLLAVRMKDSLAAGIGLAVAIAQAACSTQAFSVAAGGPDASMAESSLPETSAAESSAPEASGPSPCAGGGAAVHQLCDDFDKSSTLGLIWRPGLPCPPAVVDGSESVSPPNSLLASTQATAPACAAVATDVTKDVTAKAHCEFDVREDGTPSSSFEFFVMEVHAPNISAYQVGLSLTQGQSPPFTLAEDRLDLDAGMPVENTLPVVAGPADLSAWHHIVFELEVGPPRKLLLTFDGGPMTVMSLPLYPAGATGITVYLGVTSQSSSAATTVRHDNIWCDLS